MPIQHKDNYYGFVHVYYLFQLFYVSQRKRKGTAFPHRYTQSVTTAIYRHPKLCWWWWWWLDRRITTNYCVVPRVKEYKGKFDPFGQRRVVKVRKSFAGAKREENRRGHTFSLLCVCGVSFSPDNLDELFPMYDSRFVLHIIKYLYIYRRTEFVGAV